MTSKRRFPRSARLALATVVATGMAAAPAALTSGFGLGSNDAQAAVPPTVPAPKVTPLTTTPGGSQDPIVQKSVAVKAKPKDQDTQGAIWSANGELEGYTPLPIQNLEIRTSKPLDDMMEISLNDVPSTQALLAGQQVAMVKTDTMGTAGMAKTTPMAKNAMNKTGDMNAVTTGSIVPGSRHAAELRRYAQAATEGNMDAAATALAQSTNDFINEQYVLQLNDDLGISSSLDAQKLAQVAAAKQAIRFAESAPVSY